MLIEEQRHSSTLPRLHLARPHHAAIGGLSGIGRRRALGEAHIIGQAHEAGGHRQAFGGVAAINRPTRREIFQASRYNAIANSKIGDARAEPGDLARDFMAQNNRYCRQHRGERAIEKADIAVAEAGASHVEHHLAGTRHRIRTFDEFQRLVRTGKEPRFHNISFG